MAPTLVRSGRRIGEHTDRVRISLMTKGSSPSTRPRPEFVPLPALRRPVASLVPRLPRAAPDAPNAVISCEPIPTADVQGLPPDAQTTDDLLGCGRGCVKGQIAGRARNRRL